MKKRSYTAAPAEPKSRRSRSRHADSMQADIHSALHAPQTPDSASAAEVLELFTRLSHPLRLDDLLRYLDLSRRAKRPLLDLLNALEAQGKILRLSGGRWSAVGNAPLITGLLSIQRSGAGFVTPDGSEKSTSKAMHRDIFIRPQAMGDAWHGDRVEVLAQPARNEGRSGPGGRGKRESSRAGRAASPEGRIVRVVERRQKEVAAHALRAPAVGGRIFCRPADPRFPFLLLVDISALPKPPQPGDLLLVVTGERLEDSARNGETVWQGTASSSLGREDDARVQERLVKINHLIPLDFPPNVEAEAASLAMDRDKLPELSSAQAAALAEPSFHTSAHRQDLRGIPFVTIDGEDARDFDDAIHVTPLDAGWELRVAIADVSWFVRPNSPLDKEARSRGNSCYFPASVEPMLPEALSNGLCSLRPDEDRLVMVARIRFDAQGRQTAAAFSPGLIRSRARLTYEEVQAAFDLEAQAQNGQEKAELLEALPGLRHARELALVLHKRREAGGSLDFEIPEARFTVDQATGRVTGIQRRQRLFAHRLIEECMLAANEAVARYLSEEGAPFPYRVHPAPDRERLESLFRTLGSTGLAPELTEGASLLRISPAGTAQHSSMPHSPAQADRPYRKKQRPDGPAKPFHRADKEKAAPLSGDMQAALSKRLREVLAAGGESPHAFLINRLVLRAMMQARYAPENDGHFGLASACYCHFTSPIRRYADLLVHRALRFTLERGSAGTILAGQKLLAACEQCNARERVAVEAEREIHRRLACLVLLEHVGEDFHGVVSGVTDFGFFVEFDTMPAEGMVRLENLDDHFVYDSDRQELLGAATGQRFRLGDAVQVRLVDVHVGRLEINLELLAQEARQQRRGGPHPSGRPGATRSGRRQRGPQKNAGAAPAPGRKARRR